MKSSDQAPVSFKRPAAVAVVWAGLLTGSGLLFVEPAWDDTDDARMAMIVSDVPDEASEYLLYSNILYGSFLKTLYRLSSQVAWYGWAQVVVLTLTHAGLAYSVVSHRPSRLVVGGLAAGHVTIALYAWVRMQFSVTASLATIAGAALLHRSICEDSTQSPSTGRKWAVLCAGWLLVVVGSLIRLESCFLCLIVMAPLLAAQAFRNGDRRRVPAHLSAAAVGVGVILVRFFANRDAYESDARWRPFLSVRDPAAQIINNYSLRSLFLGGRNPNEADLARLQDADAVLAENDLTRNDLLCLFDWWYADSQVFSSKKLERLDAELVRFGADSPSEAARLLAIVIVLAAGSNQFVLLAGLSFALLLVHRTPRRSLVFVAITWLFAIGLLWLILGVQKLPARVFVPVGMACFTVTGLVVCRRQTDESGSATLSSSSFPIRLGRACLTVGILGAALVSVEHVGHSQSMSAERERVMDSIGALQRAGQFQVITVPFPFDRLSPLEPAYQLRSWRFVYLDGHQLSPRYEATLSEEGIPSLFPALLENRDLRLVTRRETTRERIREFFRQHYDADVRFVTERELSHGITVSRIKVERALD